MSVLRTTGQLLLTACMSSIGMAHPFHASTTEVEWNPNSRRFEVAMRLRISDVEDALSAQQNTRISLESHPQADKLLQQYIGRKFEVMFEGDRGCHVRWVGMEPELHDVWLYFEAESRTHSIADPLQSASGDKPQDEPVVPAGTETVREWDDLFTDRNVALSKGNAVSRAGSAVRIRNSLLTEVQPEQTNIVILRHNGFTGSVVMSVRQSEAVLGSDADESHIEKRQRLFRTNLSGADAAELPPVRSGE